MLNIESKNHVATSVQVKTLFEDILAGIKRIEETVSKRNDYDIVIKHGLEGFKSRILESEKKRKTFDPQSFIIGVIQKHPQLRFPHRKILEYLARQYDYEKKHFKEVMFSTIVKECRLGKNKAGEYLKDLDKNGLVKKRSDGYRVWFYLNLDITGNSLLFTNSAKHCR